MADRSEVIARRRDMRQRARARRELELFMRRLAFLLAALLLLFVAGSIGFAAIEGVSLGYGFVWTLDTITTVGSIPLPHDSGGRALELGLELLGIGTLFYGFVTVAEFFVSGQLSGVLAHRSLHRVRLRPGWAPGRARPAGGRRCGGRGRRQPREPRHGAGGRHRVH
jgi:hypothetical protein